MSDDLNNTDDTSEVDTPTEDTAGASEAQNDQQNGANTALSPDTSGEDKQDVKTPWGDGWRAELAEGDDKFEKQLGRYNSPKDFAKAYRELQRKLSSGEAKGALPENPSDQELAQWREANGVPNEVQDYFKDIPSGLAIGDEDKALFEDFAGAMHGLNMKPEVIHKAIEWYYDMQEQEQAALAEADSEQRAVVEDALRSEWGGEYRANINTLNNWIGAGGEDVKTALLNARGPDGHALMNNPAVVQFLAQKAREESPFATLVPAGADSTTVQDEIKALEKQMGDRNSEYWKNPAVQERYRMLVDAQDKISA